MKEPVFVVSNSLRQRTVKAHAGDDSTGTCQPRTGPRASERLTTVNDTTERKLMTAHENLNLTDASTGGSCCGHAPSADAVAQTPAEDMAECPVMAGTPVVKAEAEAAALYRDYNGQRYWLCCSSCGPLFDADPERYVTAA